MPDDREAVWHDRGHSPLSGGFTGSWIYSRFKSGWRVPDQEVAKPDSYFGDS
ncbi:MAG: hypothetical protein QOG58_477 [Caballeronia sp.]|jgi:hypothetical protein|nr:hypothetical protein [Caballeronia sp.]